MSSILTIEFIIFNSNDNYNNGFYNTDMSICFLKYNLKELSYDKIYIEQKIFHIIQ